MPVENNLCVNKTMIKNFDFRCLHLWIPHEVRSISSLFFLDDHNNLTLELVKTNFQLLY
jgi:hypothetical protein